MASSSRMSRRCQYSVPAPSSPSVTSTTRSIATGLALEKSSTTTTSQPAASSSTAVWLPM